jgi:hypothetical protein
MKWIELPRNEYLKEKSWVARLVKKVGGGTRVDITVGLDGWGFVDNRVTHYAPLPPHPAIDMTGWFSEYRSNEPPSKSGWYLAGLDWTRTAAAQKGYPCRKVTQCYYDKQRDRFSCVPDDCEVIAWKPFPGPPAQAKAAA